jgi:hypothetical protein
MVANGVEERPVAGVGEVWWYRHRAEHRASQLYGLYTSLTLSFIEDSQSNKSELD